jgi:hypothetical protein
MVTIDDMLANFRSIDLDQAVYSIVRSESKELINLNIDQLKHGITSEGATISPYYRSKEYADEKHRINPFPGYGVPDLRNTGDFYRGFFIKVSKTIYELGSTDQKSDYLEGKYSKNGGIFGINNENRTKFCKEVVRPRIISYIESKTGIRFR